MHKSFDKRRSPLPPTTVFSAPSKERIKTIRLSIIRSLFRYHPRVKCSWKGRFRECVNLCGDVNGRLDVYGWANLLRERLRIYADEMTNEEIEHIFYIIDEKKKEGKINETEIIDFLQYEEAPYVGEGEDIDNHKQHLRTLRIKRNFQLACRSLGVGQEFVKKAFYAYDKDGSGNLSFSEFRTGLRFDLKISRWEMKEADIVYMFKILDRDRSGNVDVEELVSFLSEGMKKGEQKMGVSESMRDLSLLWHAVESGARTVPRSIRHETPLTMSSTPKGVPSAAELLARKRRCLSRSFSWTSLSVGTLKHYSTPVRFLDGASCRVWGRMNTSKPSMMKEMWGWNSVFPEAPWFGDSMAPSALLMVVLS